MKLHTKRLSSRQAAVLAAILLFLTITGPTAREAAAQSAPKERFAGADVLAAIGAPARLNQVPDVPDTSSVTRLSGYVPTWADSVNDAGAPSPGTEMRLTFVLNRSPESGAAFAQFLAAQQDKNGPYYHQWLAPQDIGRLYGPTDHDVAAFSNWLRGQGLTVLSVAPSGIFVEVAAPVQTVARALSTAFRLYTVPGTPQGRPRIAATAEPALPSVFVPLVKVIHGLSGTTTHPLSHIVARTAAAPEGAGSEFTSATGHHYLAPADFNTIYDIAPVLASHIDGTGQRVAILGKSRIAASDIASFESITGLPSKGVNTIIPPLGLDPGPPSQSNDQEESTLDIERVLGTAPGVQVDLVSSADNPFTGSDGIVDDAMYNVNTLLDPIMSISYGACEIEAYQIVPTLESIYEQGAAEGISTFASSGDSGAAGCTPISGAYINALCSSGYVTCVGGTEFNDPQSSSYWGTSNSASLGSALGYIPEGSWNDPGTPSAPEVAAGGGGVSLLTSQPSWQTGPGVPDNSSSVYGGRTVPDVSFSASGDHDGYLLCYATFTTQGTAYGDCSQSSQGPSVVGGTSAAAPSMAGIAALLDQKEGGAQGNINPQLYLLAAETYGYPAATIFHDVTPASSGVDPCDPTVASLCNDTTPLVPGLNSQETIGDAVTPGYDAVTGWGSIDVSNLLKVYGDRNALAPTSTVLTSSSSTVTAPGTFTLTATVSSSSSAIPKGVVQFYRVTGSNSVPQGSPVTLVAGKATSSAITLAAGSYEFTAAYQADSTFAFAVSDSSPAFVRVLSAPSPASTATLSASAASITSLQSVVLTANLSTTHSTVAPTGNFQFFDGYADTDSVIATVPVNADQAITSPLSLAAGVHYITASYSGDSVYPAASSPVVVVTVSSATASTATAVVARSLSVSPAQPEVFTASVTSTANGTPAGTVEFLDGTTPLAAPVALSSGTAVSPVLYLSAGSHSVKAVYSGSTGFASSTSSATVIVSLNPTSTSLAFSTTPTNTGETVALTAKIGSTTTTAGSPTGTVQFMDGAQAVGTPVPVNNAMASATLNLQTSGVHSVTAAYSGDSAFAASASPVTSITVTVPATASIAPAQASLSLSAGAASGNTDPLTVTSVGGFAGPVSLTCQVSGGNGGALPGCSLSPAVVSLSAGGTASSTLTITSAAATCTTSASTTEGPAGSGGGVAYAALLLFLLPLRRKLRWSALSVAVGLLAVVSVLNGCAGAKAPATPACVAEPATKSGAYVVTINGTASGAATGIITSVTVNIQ